MEDEEEVVVEEDAAERRLVVRQVSEGGDGPSRVTEHHEVSGSQPSGSTISTTLEEKRGCVVLQSFQDVHMCIETC